MNPGNLYWASMQRERMYYVVPAASIHLFPGRTDCKSIHRFNCLRAELRVMKSGAAIVNCSSVAGLIGTPGAAGYVAGQA